GTAVDEGAAPQNEEVAGVPGHLHVRPWEEAAGGFEHRLVPQVVVADPSDVAGVRAAILRFGLGPGGRRRRDAVGDALAAGADELGGGLGSPRRLGAEIP